MASCVGCARLRDELALVRHQLTTHRASAPTEPPPLLYQLQKSVPRPPPAVAAAAPVPARQPAASPTRVMPAATQRTAPAAKPKAAATPAIHTKKPSTVDHETQTLVSDLAPHALAESSGCDRCVCCELGHVQAHALVAAREEWRGKYDDVVSRNRQLEGEVAQLVANLRALRVEAQKHALPTPAAKSHPAQPIVDSRADEQEKVIRLLRQQHAADQQLLERLQLQVQQLQRQAPLIAAPTTSPPSHADGLSALQRHQQDIRASAEQALLRLQQLFPGQAIGT